MAASGVIEFKDAQDLQDRASLPEHSGPFTVMRGDTNGEKYPVVERVSEEFAKSVLTHMERYTHHQGYSITNPNYKPS